MQTCPYDKSRSPPPQHLPLSRSLASTGPLAVESASSSTPSSAPSGRALTREVVREPRTPYCCADCNDFPPPVGGLKSRILKSQLYFYPHVKIDPNCGNSLNVLNARHHSRSKTARDIRTLLQHDVSGWPRGPSLAGAGAPIVRRCFSGTCNTTCPVRREAHRWQGQHR